MKYWSHRSPTTTEKTDAGETRRATAPTPKPAEGATLGEELLSYLGWQRREPVGGGDSNDADTPQELRKKVAEHFGSDDPNSLLPPSLLSKGEFQPLSQEERNLLLAMARACSRATGLRFCGMMLLHCTKPSGRRRAPDSVVHQNSRS